MLWDAYARASIFGREDENQDEDRLFRIPCTSGRADDDRMDLDPGKH